MVTEDMTPGGRRSICFVSAPGTTGRPVRDPSAHWRCHAPAERLAAAGHRVVVVADDRFFAEPVPAGDVYVFQRPDPARPDLVDQLDRLRRAGARLVADVDTVDVSAAGAEVLGAFDAIAASTDAIAADLRALLPGKPVTVVPTTVPASVIDLHRGVGTPFRPRGAGVIGCFPVDGADDDFAVVDAVLRRVLAENPDFTLLVGGSVTLSDRLAALPNVAVAPAVDHRHVPTLASLCGTILAPLGADGAAARGSPVPMLEAALGGCRLVATPVPGLDFGPAVRAADADAWYEALSAPPGEPERLAAARVALAGLDREDGAVPPWGESA